MHGDDLGAQVGILRISAGIVGDGVLGDGHRDRDADAGASEGRGERGGADERIDGRRVGGLDGDIRGIDKREVADRADNGCFGGDGNAVFGIGAGAGAADACRADRDGSRSGYDLGLDALAGGRAHGNVADGGDVALANQRLNLAAAADGQRRRHALDRWWDCCPRSSRQSG